MLLCGPSAFINRLTARGAVVFLFYASTKTSEKTSEAKGAAQNAEAETSN